MAFTIDMTNILEVIENIHLLREERDEQLIRTYMQELRDTGSLPSKVVDRALDWTERLLFRLYPERDQVISMRLASYYVSMIAKQVGVHSGQRKQEKIVSE